MLYVFYYLYPVLDGSDIAWSTDGMRQNGMAQNGKAQNDQPRN